MNGWHAEAMRRVHDFGVSCLIRGVSGTLAGSSPEVSGGDATLGWPWDAADRVFGPYGVNFCDRLGVSEKPRTKGGS